jgi:hypothetical protein
VYQRTDAAFFLPFFASFAPLRDYKYPELGPRCSTYKSEPPPSSTPPATYKLKASAFYFSTADFAEAPQHGAVLGEPRAAFFLPFFASFAPLRDSNAFP